MTARCAASKDADEACWLLSGGWIMLEAQTLTRWTFGRESVVTASILGLPQKAFREVADVSLSLLGQRQKTEKIVR